MPNTTQAQDAILLFLWNNGSSYIEHEMFENLCWILGTQPNEHSYKKELQAAIPILINEQYIKETKGLAIKWEDNKATGWNVIYKITQKGINRAVDDIKDPILLRNILDTEQKKAELIKRLLLFLDWNSQFNAKDELQYAFQKCMDRGGNRDKCRLFFKHYEDYAILFFIQEGFLVRGNDNEYVFNERGKKLIQIGNLEEFYKWEGDREERERLTVEYQFRLLQTQIVANESQVETNANVKATNEHIKDNNIFLNRVFRWTVIAAFASLLVSIISLLYSIKDYNREVEKEHTEQKKQTSNSELQVMRSEISLLKNEIDSLELVLLKPRLGDTGVKRTP